MAGGLKWRKLSAEGGQGHVLEQFKALACVAQLSGSSCAYTGLVLGCTGVLSGEAPRPPKLSSYKQGPECARYSYPGKAEALMQHMFHSDSTKKQESGVGFDLICKSFNGPWIWWVLGPGPALWFPKATWQNILSFFFLISYLKLHSGEREHHGCHKNSSQELWNAPEHCCRRSKRAKHLHRTDKTKHQLV